MGQAEPVALCKAARFLSGRGFLSRRRLRRYYSGRHWILRSPGAFICLPLHLLRLNARMQHLPHVLLRLLGFVLQLILPRLLKFDQLLGSRRVIWGLFHQIADLLASHIEMLRQPFQIGNLAAQYFSLIIMSHRSLSFLQPLQPRKCSSSPFIIQDQNPKAEIVHRLYVRGSTFKPALPAYATPHPDTAAECGCMPVRPAVLHVQHPEWPPRSAEALIDPPPLSFYAIPAATPDHRVLQTAAAHAETNAPILCRIYGAIHHSDPYPHFRLALHICL